MLEQILEQGFAHFPLIITVLLAVGVALELVHIGQTRKINKRLGQAGSKLQGYLDTVLSGSSDEDSQTVQVDMPQPQASVSRQEQDMRVVIEQHKQQRDEEMLETVDAVLQEVFDS